MARDFFGKHKPPSRCCGAAIVPFETPTSRGFLCSACIEVIKAIPKSDDLATIERIPKATMTIETDLGGGMSVISRPIEVSNVNIQIKRSLNEEINLPRSIAASYTNNQRI